MRLKNLFIAILRSQNHGWLCQREARFISPFPSRSQDSQLMASCHLKHVQRDLQLAALWDGAESQSPQPTMLPLIPVCLHR